MGRPLGSYVMEHVLFKVSFPAEFHAQTAVECAMQLHPVVKDRLSDIRKITIRTHESAVRIICKDGPLNNPADRDHCLQYMTAVGLLLGDLAAEHYEDAFHRANPAIDRLRALMTVEEQPSHSADYLDPSKRSIPNAIQVFFADGSATECVAVEYPVGHRRRRAEGIPLLERKFASNLHTRFPEAQCGRIMDLCLDQKRLEQTAADRFMDLFVIN
jgi:2-methylcitrate dehydratase